MQNILKINNYLQNQLRKYGVIHFAFCFFLIFYFLNFDKYTNLFSTDFKIFYKPEGLLIVEQLLGFNFKNINFFDFYLIPKLITGILLKLTPNEYIFSILSNFLNIIALFLSIYFYSKTFKTKNKNKIIFIFFIIFFLYIGNWVWVFWKLADIYFLFLCSLIFYFLNESFEKQNKFKLFYIFLFTFMSLLTKPNSAIIILFIFSSVFLFFIYKKNFFKLLFILLILYSLLFPLSIFFLTKFDFNNGIFNYFISSGKILWNYQYSYEKFMKDFLLIESNFTYLIYQYFIFFKKILYQLTFLRETYSFKHNLFLSIYMFLIYFFLIINIDYLKKNFNFFLKLTTLLSFFSIIFYSSLFTCSEPNRCQLFFLTPLYMLTALSINNSLAKFINILKYFK